MEKPNLVDVRKALYDLMTIPGKTIKAKKILKKCGATNVPDLDPKQYGKVIKKAKKAMVK